LRWPGPCPGFWIGSLATATAAMLPLSALGGWSGWRRIQSLDRIAAGGQTVKAWITRVNRGAEGWPSNPASARSAHVRHAIAGAPGRDCSLRVAHTEGRVPQVGQTLIPGVDPADRDRHSPWPRGSSAGRPGFGWRGSGAVPAVDGGGGPDAEGWPVGTAAPALSPPASACRPPGWTIRTRAGAIGPDPGRKAPRRHLTTPSPACRRRTGRRPAADGSATPCPPRGEGGANGGGKVPGRVTTGHTRARVGPNRRRPGLSDRGRPRARHG